MARLLVLLVLLGGLAWADRLVMVPAGAVVTEPGQKAVIGFNGSEEILILTTDLRAAKPTRVLQALPLPGRPTVAPANPRLLAELKDLLNRRDVSMSGQGLRSGGNVEGVQLLEHKKLGPHNLVVLELTSVEQLNVLLQKELREKLPAAGVSIVEGYLKRGCRYLVVDVVELTADTGSVPPVAYRFPSQELFYPLMTSNLVGGEGAVDLFCLTPPETARSLQEGSQLPFPPLNNDDLFVPRYDEPKPGEELPEGSRYSGALASVSRQDLEKLDPALAGLLPNGAQLYVHHYSGPLRFGRDLTVTRSWLGLGPVQRAAMSGNLEALKAALREHPEGLEETDFAHRTPLLRAIDANSATVVQLLLGAGAAQGRALFAAARSTPEIVELLLKAGADVNQRTDNGETPVMRAACWDRHGTLAVLLNAGARVDDRDSLGNTALHLAAAYGNLDNVRFLLQRGASPTARNAEGKTPEQVATGAAVGAFDKP